MAIKPGVHWRGPVPNKTPGGMARPIIGLVLHVEQGSETGSISWFHNPVAQASAHFGNPKTGGLDQVVDTSDKAWAECAGNPKWVSVEHEGMAGEHLTPSQLENDSDLLAWLHHTEGVALQTTDNINMGGVGWHGMGRDLWGGHYECGQSFRPQRAEIIKGALTILHQAPAASHPAAPATPSTNHPAVKPAHEVPALHRLLAIGATGEDVRELQAQLKRRGWRVTVDGDFGPVTQRIVAAFQAQKHLKVDGEVGEITWHALYVATVTAH